MAAEQKAKAVLRPRSDIDVQALFEVVTSVERWSLVHALKQVEYMVVKDSGRD